MSSLVASLVLLSVIAAICGYFVGLCFAFAKDEFADHKKHPVLHVLTRRSSPLINFPLALIAWSLFLYGIPKVVFLLFGIEDANAFGMALGVDIAFAYLGLLVGERTWKHVA